MGRFAISGSAPFLVQRPHHFPQSALRAREVPCWMLIVDDNQDFARSLSTIQRLRGHETRTAFTGPDALIAAAEFIPEVVLMDIGLPGMGGNEVARRLRAMPEMAGAFLVAMTGYGSDNDRAVGKQAGFDEYFVKPVDLDLLRAPARPGWQKITRLRTVGIYKIVGPAQYPCAIGLLPNPSAPCPR